MAKTCKSSKSARSLAREYMKAQQRYEDDTGDNPIADMLEIAAMLAEDVLSNTACVKVAPKKPAGLSGRRRR